MSFFIKLKELSKFKFNFNVRPENPLFIKNKKSFKIFKTTEKIVIPDNIKKMLTSNTDIKNENSPVKRSSYFSFLLKFFSNFKNIIEILNILRPLIHFNCIVVFKRSSWIPIFISFFIDLIILRFKRDETNFTQQKIYFIEYYSRYNAMFTYLLKEPFLSQITKPLINAIISRILPSFLVSFIMNMLDYFSNFYYSL